MTTRGALIVGVSIFLGLVVSSRFLDQPSLGQPTPVAADHQPRFQMTTLNTPHGDYVIVFDSTTGQCWSQVPAQVNDNWQDMGIPNRMKKQPQKVQAVDRQPAH